MGPRPSLLLVLVLCLGPAIHTQEGVLPKPSIWAEPGPVSRQGQPMTIVCWSPVRPDIFRLEDENRNFCGDQTVTPPYDSNGTKATFSVPTQCELTVRGYRCLYREGPIWSERSEILRLKVAETTPELTAPPSAAGSQSVKAPGESAQAPASQDYTVGNCVRIGLSGVVLLILVGILAEAGHSWHRRPHQPQEGRQESAGQRN